MDFIIDCIDNLPTKIHLIKECTDRKLPLIVACGAAAKQDPTKLLISDISETNVCEL